MLSILFQCQAHCTEALIRKEFEQIHQFLLDEEATRVSSLREEEKQKVHRAVTKKSQMIRDILVLSEKVTAAEEELDADNISFLQVIQYILNTYQCVFNWNEHKADSFLFLF